MQGIIYLITNQINGHQYVGQTTTTLQLRWRKHVSKSKEANPTGLAAAIKKYGEENFTKEILCTCTSKEELNQKEQYYI